MPFQELPIVYQLLVVALTSCQIWGAFVAPVFVESPMVVKMVPFAKIPDMRPAEVVPPESNDRNPTKPALGNVSKLMLYSTAAVLVCQAPELSVM